MQTLWQDLRYGVRTLAKKPGFTIVAIVTLALGIGANTAIFSLVNTVLFKPFPVKNSHELVSLSVKGKKGNQLAFSYPNYLDFRARNTVLSDVYVTRISPMSVSLAGNNLRVWGNLVSGNFFETLGVSAMLGRTFTAEDDKTRLGSPVAVISHGCWQRRFGGDPGAIGRDMLINGHGFKVIGVMKEGFKGTELLYTPEIWVPVTMQPWIEPGGDWLDRRSVQNCFAVGRLKPGVTPTQAEAALNLLARQLAAEYPDANEGQVIELVPPGFIIPSIRGAFVSFSAVLMGTVALVLLIACTNLAGLLLARATDRRREIAIRLAIGANRGRIVRQLLTESLLLSLAGGCVGLLLAAWLVSLSTAFRPPLDIPIGIELSLDPRVMAFSLAVSVVTGIVFGLAPALQASRPDIVPTLKDTVTQTGIRRSWLRGGLIVGQVAMSLLLLAAAGLFLRALGQVQTMDPGFTVENGLMLSFDVGLQGYDKARGLQFQRQMLDRVRALPGVRGASTTDLFPLSLNYSSNDFYAEGQTVERGANRPTAMVASVAPTYFATMETRLVAGRDFTDQDTESAPRVAVVNEAFVRRFFPGLGQPAEAVGKRVSSRGPEGPWLQIVGVAQDGKYWTLGETSQPFVWFSSLQTYSAGATLVVRTAGDPHRLIGPVRDIVRDLDSTLPVYDVKTVVEHMSFSLLPSRIAAVLLGCFGALALALAAIGLYGVTSYAVAQGTREIGIRMALGARAGDVMKLMVKQALVLVTIGIVLGLIAALSVTRLAENLLFGVSATDPLTFTGVSVILLTVAAVACLIPARRATRVDPVTALRAE